MYKITKEPPKGWRNYRDEFRYYYPNQEVSNPIYQSCVYYNHMNGVSYFQISGTSSYPINIEKSRKQIAKDFKETLGIQKYICVLDSQQQRKNKNSGLYRNILQFHTVLKSIPSPEILEKINELGSSYLEAEE